MEEPPRILVLAGWVASGKSSFAKELAKWNTVSKEKNHEKQIIKYIDIIQTFLYQNFIHISQDALGTRKACEQLARKSLTEVRLLLVGKSIIIDRQNFDQKQRKTWIQLASDFTNSNVPLECDLIEFATPYEECARRLQQRTHHETIHSINQGIGILKLVSSKQWKSPHISEGFNRHLILLPPDSKSIHPTTTAHLTYPITQELIENIIKTLNSIPINITTKQQKPTINQIQSPTPTKYPSSNQSQIPSNQSNITGETINI
ncbi:uncharacterized protein VP01_343g3 [Puccinia sorghi]|uniref:Uncharacterized protein n=1 Tax=Puccinia sorghi TaxID=27349 RepID=A0A0L6UW87_9BASI|nr:uncharacterized protein VP01_343g3 [Puccinia sorghi]